MVIIRTAVFVVNAEVLHVGEREITQRLPSRRASVGAV
jgi:hypothetical protein